jgi:hypothetical protein
VGQGYDLIYLRIIRIRPQAAALAFTDLGRVATALDDEVDNV